MNMTAPRAARAVAAPKPGCAVGLAVGAVVLTSGMVAAVVTTCIGARTVVGTVGEPGPEVLNSFEGRAPISMCDLFATPSSLFVELPGVVLTVDPAISPSCLGLPAVRLVPG